MQVEVEGMLSKQAIEETTPRGRGFVSTLFLVPRKDGGQRPVINLKSLNTFVHTEHFKIEGIHVLKDLLRAGDLMAKVDLKDAYFMLPIREEDRVFLKFSLKDRTYRFKCLLFGLACTPWVFTKTLKPVAAQLRQLGVQLIVYIDDILILAESKELARDHAIGLVYLLENLGFAISKAKCQLEPMQTIEFLGFSVNSLTQELSLPSGKVKKIRTDTRALLEGRQASIRKLSQLLDKLQAAARAIPLAPLFFHKLQRALRRGLDLSGQNYSSQLTLSAEEQEELQWWLDHLTAWNGKTLVTEKPSIVIESDASTRGWGGDVRGSLHGRSVVSGGGQFHINCQEALAAFHALKCFVRDRRSVSVLLRLDNTSAVSYVNKLGGTVSPRLNKIVRNLWLWCMNRDITLTAEHLPGVLNTIADEESRVMKDRSDWMLNPQIFCKIQARRGPLEVDMFASRLTTQLERFFSWRPDPEADTLDAFNQDWTTHQGKGYANPPWNLVGHVLSRVRQLQVTIVLIAPVWTNQPWHPVLLGMLIDSPVLLPQRSNTIHSTHPGCVPELMPQLAVWHISGDVTRTKKFRRTAQSCSSPQLLFRKWVDWCIGRSSDPASGPISEVVNFLAHLFKEGYQYRSLNAYRSAISSVHKRVDGYEVGQHPLISRVMKGAFHLRPPQPRYDTTWDVTRVLDYIRSQGSSDSLPLRDLTWKLAMLLALTRPSRSADLVKLDLRFRRFTPEGVVFQEAGLAKQSRSGKPRAKFFFPAFTDRVLCPRATLQTYERRTESPRLFLAVVKPRKLVSPSTLAKWLKTLLEKAGIDTGIFKAHSIRGAAVSAAANAGVTTSDILRAADWSSESVFTKFYYKPVRFGTFGAAVLSKGGSNTLQTTTVDMETEPSEICDRPRENVP